ncbi:MAG TPA: PilZ domain-containing protein [Burkholderiales bacterium]|nr:PilZ domain-containing protein [Burkholderiales bacterium]HYA46314.1 PilZ domain-containing protein [Burkholderiales bacterium]
MRREMRAEARIAVSQKGSLKVGDTSWFPCVVMEMSDHGLSIICVKKLSVGQPLLFRCQLYPDKNLVCKLEVKHAAEARMGTKIVGIDKRGASLLQSYLQERYSERLNRAG